MPGETAAPTPRVLSVDILRGLTVALMILVNDPGDWGHLYPQLDHAAWNGCTLTDLVFPTFLFLAGCSIAFALGGRLERGDSRPRLARHIALRAAKILLLGWFLTLIPYLHITRLRLFGVLPRIALCYLAAALLYLWTQRARNLALIAAGILLGYWLLMRFVPVPGLGTPTHEIPLLDPDRNLAAWLDRAFTAFTQHWLHTGRLYEKTRDPEGLLSTLPAIATTLLGLLTGLWLRLRQPMRTTLRGLLVAATLCMIAGLLWSHSFPLNKRLWTSSYVLVTAGWALLALAVLYAAIEIAQLQTRSRAVTAVLWPWRVFGSNAIAAFTVSVLLVKFLLYFHCVGPAGKTITWEENLYLTLFARHGSTALTSLAFALAFTAACFVPVWLLWRRRIFLKL